MQQGFNITNILMDGQFTYIRGNLAEIQMNLNICSNDKHMGKIEQLNCTVKEWVRGIYNTLHFKNIPGRIIVELVALVIFCLNNLPYSPSAGGNLGPLQITTRLNIY